MHCAADSAGFLPFQKPALGRHRSVLILTSKPVATVKLCYTPVELARLCCVLGYKSVGRHFSRKVELFCCGGRRLSQTTLPWLHFGHGPFSPPSRGTQCELYIRPSRQMRSKTPLASNARSKALLGAPPRSMGSGLVQHRSCRPPASTPGGNQLRKP
ncbi:hypothetical protein KVR01_010172 [Diaporthe batatas]|uniref:uncharacterized protein n=1 Tax=Diaporthe batatas TaxID=748121 RepID=UPI001D05903D|nr:uncharacterized protein KVR01_010172 [Diaporthe batatas]KAG8159535.1 hypothetical protein KVR01_010172 [Diaporthe batatas]